MSKKNKNYVFVFDGKIVDNESMIELKLEAEDDEWEMIVAQTVDFYLQLNTIYKSCNILEKEDIRIMRRLKATLEMIKKIDSATYNKHMTQDKQDEFVKIAKEEISKIDSTIKIGYNNKLNGLDITVSKL